MVQSVKDSPGSEGPKPSRPSKPPRTTRPSGLDARTGADSVSIEISDHFQQRSVVRGFGDFDASLGRDAGKDFELSLDAREQSPLPLGKTHSPPERQETKKLSVMIQKDLHKNLRVYAARKGITLTELISSTLEAKLLDLSND